MFAVTYFVNVMDLVGIALFVLLIIAAATAVLVDDIKMWFYRRKLNARRRGKA